MKLCKDCRWVKRKLFYGWDHARCHNPNSALFKIDSVSGKVDPGYCSIERKKYFATDNCGPEGKYFEPKRSEQQTKKEYERFKLWWK